MIGRLLNLGSASNGLAGSQDQAPSGLPRPLLSLGSVQEDIHTRNLLFPDSQTLYQHRNDQVFPFSTALSTSSAGLGGSFDYNDEIDLDVRDVRILIMQDNLGATNASLLFDSHPVAEVDRTPPATDARRNPLSPRKGSISHSRPIAVHTESTQTQFRQGAFDRRGSAHSRNQSQAETDSQRAYREYREELTTFSSCIFGNSELMAYKGTSTKVHVVPNDARVSDNASIIGDGRSSIGRSSMRSSKLSQSFSSQSLSPISASMPPVVTAISRQNDGKKVLITRLFPVNLATEDVEPSDTPQSLFADDNDSAGFPFPSTVDEASSRQKKKKQPKQRRTPMYAVVLVVQLPPATLQVSSAVPSRSTFREPGSYNEQEVYSSSYNSVRAAAAAAAGGWNMFGSGMPTDPNESTFALDVEDRIDCLTQHWDIVMRTLTHLQSLSAKKIHQLLKHADSASPGPQAFPPRNAVLNERRSAELCRVKPAKSTTKLVSLIPNCLAGDVDIACEAGLARSRIVMGLSATRVITGQGRWGIWRDEAIWAAKWASSLKKGAFLHNLLTGFLATHLDWLSALSSPSYRRKAALQARQKHDEDMSLPARTIIISDDKMAARRLVFLLSAFFPSSEQLSAPRAHRASTSTSIGPLSHSPPTFVVPVLREESLRRRMNRRNGLRRASHSRVGSQSARISTVMPQFAQFGLEQQNHGRRASDVASIRTTNLPLAGSDMSTRKSSAATTATIMQESTMPHFISLQRCEGHSRNRPASNSSFAADDLKRSLTRGGSNTSLSTTSSRPPSSGLKWGNLMSGFWTPRRRDSLESNTASQNSDIRSPLRSGFSRNDRLAEMVQESVVLEETGQLPNVSSCRASTNVPRPTVGGQGTIPRLRASFSQVDRTPDPTGVFESPVKTSINPDDGIIDVDVPFPDYIASFESAISSPSSSGYLSTPGLPGPLDFFEQSARITVDGDTPLNAAGWISRFHPDFAIQAMPPQEKLVERVKSAMRAEPTPAQLCTRQGDMDERWVGVSSVIIADTRTNTVSRIVHRRLVKLRPGPADVAAAQPMSAHTPLVLPYETQLDEEWIEDTVVEADRSLVEALEKVVGVGSDSGNDGSGGLVASQGQRAFEENRPAGITPDSLSETTEMGNVSADVPRVQCKTVILSALEDIMRDVIDQRDENGDAARTTSSSAKRPSNLLREAVRSWVMNLEAAQ